MGWAARLNKAGVMPKRPTPAKTYRPAPGTAAPRSNKLAVMLFMSQMGMLSAYQRGTKWTPKW